MLVFGLTLLPGELVALLRHTHFNYGDYAKRLAQRMRTLLLISRGTNDLATFQPHLKLQRTFCEHWRRSTTTAITITTTWNVDHAHFNPDLT